MADAAQPSLSARAAATFQVRSGEGTRTALLFAHLLLASSIFILGRTVRDTLFLSRYPLSALPWMFVLYGGASALTVVVYSLVADRMQRHRLIALSTAIGAITYLGTWLLVRAGTSAIYPVFYVWSEVAANLFIVQFWTLANDLHDPRSARRLFPFIGSARILGVVLIGLLSGAIVEAVGTEQLLFVLIAMMGGIAIVAHRLGREPRQAVPKPKRRRGGRPRIVTDPYVRWLSVFLLLAFTALTIGDYQFKAIARETYREDELARFFSLFYAGTGVLSFLFQIFVTPRLLKRFGVGSGMAVMPALFGGASALLPFVPHLSVATIMKFADNGLQYTIHETTLQALYAPFAPEVKARTRAFLDAVVKPMSYGAGGLVLVVLAPMLEVHMLSLVTVGISVVWLLVVPRVRRRYLQSLESTLSAKGGLALETTSIADVDAEKALISALQSPSPRTTIYALEQLEDLPSALIGSMVDGLARESPPEVRAAALKRLAALPGAAPDAALEALGATNADVRAAAARTCAIVMGDDAIEPLGPLLRDASLDVRVSALAGIMQQGGVEGCLAGGARLGELLSSPQAKERAEAARVLRRLGQGAFRPVERLLRDPSKKVRREALKAAQRVADPRLLPLLGEALLEPSTSGRAGAAMVSIGEPAVDRLLQVLQNVDSPRPVRLAIPRLLRRIPSMRTLEGLRAHSNARDGHLRLRVLSALSRVHEQLGAPREPLDTLVERVTDELERAYMQLASWEGLRDLYATPLLEEELEFRQTRSVRRLLRLLELRYDRETLKLVRRGLDDPRRRANAIEVLDTIIDPSLRALILPFLDDIPARERVARAEGMLQDVPSPEAFLLAECEHPNPFVVAVAIDALVRHPSERVLGAVHAALSHRSPMVRETALHALSRLGSVWSTDLRDRVLPLVDDPVTLVSRRARATLDANLPAEVTMLTTLEKLLHLKSAKLFREVAAEDLAPLALLADDVSFGRGEIICTEGELGDELYVIVSGQVEVTHGGQTLATFGPGDAFGEMAVLDAEPRSATVTAAEDTELLAIGSEEFYESLHEQVEIAEGVIRLLTHRLREANPKGVSDRQSRI